MVGFEAEEVAKPVLMDETLWASIRVGHIVDEFAREGLVGEIALKNATATSDDAAIGMGERGLIIGHRWIYRRRQMMDGWIEEVEYRLAPRPEVPPDGAEAGELFLHSQQILKRTEWQGDELKVRPRSNSRMSAW